jgi:hypothetical protein
MEGKNGTEKERERETRESNSAKNIKYRKKRSFYYKREFLHIPQTIWRGKYNIVMLMYYIKQHKNILFGQKNGTQKLLLELIIS